MFFAVRNAILATALLLSYPCVAEDGSAAWLRYAPVPAAPYASLPSHIFVHGDSPVERSAGAELARGLTAMLGRSFDVVTKRSEGSIELTLASGASTTLESYTIDSTRRHLRIAGNTPQAELYGAFHLLEEIAAARPIPAHEASTAAAPVRWTNEWDNLDGSIERGYAGQSFFFEKGHVRQDLTRASAYARLLASVGINGCNANNVNADLDLLTSDHLKEYARLADAFRPWGVRLALSVDLTSPQAVGGLPTFDPLDPTVIAWWQRKVDEIYTLIPDFAGFTVKADSEGRKGPAQYGRSPADAANVLARALAPHHGVVLYRGFVYDNHLDWRDPKADRARAGVDNFAKYDGRFEPNVIIQIKEGPIDFQAREPVNPLFAALPHTNVAIEVQASQEYTGQQRHMVWLPSMWRWVLDTDLRAEGRHTPVKEIVTGRAFPLASGAPRPGGFVSVTNAGLDANWMHHPMAMANLYGFGKLAWNPDEPLDRILDTWTRLTWGNDPLVVRTVNAMQLKSWQVYEGYTGPNGVGTLTNILGYHFGPDIESAERNGWGQWIRGEKNGIGMDRTAAGTGYAQLYPPLVAARYESLATCPDDLLLFFHHVPYDHKLHTGQTLIQSIYDTHYKSAREAGEYAVAWSTLEGRVDPERYRQVAALFNFQAGHAIVWRDAIDTWFERISGIADDKGRVDRHPLRIEAESMTATGYEPIDVTPSETASGGKAMVCRNDAGCTLSTVLQQPAGAYDIAVQYFDTWAGVSNYELLVNGVSQARWSAADTLAPVQFDPHLDGQTSTRYTAHHLAIKPGDTLTLRGVPDLRETLKDRGRQTVEPGAMSPPNQRRDYREFAPIDYIVLGPDGPLTPQD
ncbi:alpha-glucuronidase [Granulicella rosea]|uniref:Xylan alpha-1,2-glucuronidase n=1 Tax=Granulicella rosea TaxID=474952 RepID=A0A239M1E7_9BACT|nr:alpha-glucuronidase family glycosyl hydrolase [Granulicella rosea]SNT36556.1 alpha-glucuronidase [Granulicella rosea]